MPKLTDASQTSCMSDWLTALAAQSVPSILITVAQVNGSAPREPGAKMLVTRERQFDTIGGGHLEMRACEIAHAMLNSSSGSLSSERRLQRFSLGPSLGQCCGGEAVLFFERVDPSGRSYVGCLAERRRNAQDSWRVVAVESLTPPTLADASGTCHAGQRLALLAQLDYGSGCHLILDQSGKRWVVDPCRAYRPHLMLFGAGHVGAAIVRALAELPCHVTWTDERDDMFPQVLPANVMKEATDIPEAVIASAAPGSSFLVLTHSHALDLRLAEHILRRDDYVWFGLIGSNTKRIQFERRLRERGVPAERLAKMVCPIGIPGINSKAPAVIATAVAAQLLQVWETDALPERPFLSDKYLGASGQERERPAQA
jgi:xanthine dehydrogenase accessory factor